MFLTPEEENLYNYNIPCFSEQLSLDTEPPCKKSKPQLSVESENGGKLVVESSFDNTQSAEEVGEVWGITPIACIE